MRKGISNIIIGVLFGFLGIGELLLANGISIPYIFMGFNFVVNGIFQNKGYYNKTYFMTQFSIIAIFGIILSYICIFIPKFFGNNVNSIYLTFAALIGFLIILIYDFYRRENNSRVSWRNEW